MYDPQTTIPIACYGNGFWWIFIQIESEAPVVLIDLFIFNMINSESSRISPEMVRENYRNETSLNIENRSITILACDNAVVGSTFLSVNKIIGRPEAP